MAEFTSSLPTAEVAARFEQAGVPAAEVRDPNAAVRDSRLVARGETVPILHPEFGAVGDVMGMGMPIRFSRSTVGLDRPAPRLGEHNDLVYGELLGYPAEKIQDLEARHVI